MKELFSIIICSSVLVPLGARAFDGGAGTEASPYLIKTVADLTELATEVNGGNTYEDKYFLLNNDITFTASDTFTPIGYTGTTTPKRFNGNFDGNGKTISGMKMEGSYYLGFFAYVDAKGTIKNLSLDNITFTSSNSYGGTLAARLDGVADNIRITNLNFTTSYGGYKGGVIGYLNNGTLSNSYINGSLITTTPSIGGMVGQNYGTISRCHSAATVASQAGYDSSSGSMHLGGIASVTLVLNGKAEIFDSYFTGSIMGSSLNNCGGITATFNKGTIERCWNGGYISSSGNAGGIVGTYNAGDIRNCYNAGAVYGTATSATYGQGGIAGYVSVASTSTATMTNVYNIGSLFVPTVARTEGCEILGLLYQGNVTMNNVYYDRQTCGYTDAPNGLPTSTLVSGTLPQGFDSEVWVAANNLYPRLKTSAQSDAAILHATPFILSGKEDHAHVKSNFTVSTANDVEWQVRGTGAKLSGNTVTVTRSETMQNLVLTSYLGDLERRSLVSVYPQIFTGEGTADSPYLLAGAADWQKFAKLVNESGLEFSGEYLKLTDDANFSGLEYIPVGFNTSGYIFDGTLDCGGHSIKNLQLDTRTNSVMNIGIFTSIGPRATVKNLNVDKSCRFLVHRNFGVICANLFGTIDNCRNYADVPTAAGYSAGIACFINSGGVVKNSLNAGAITSENIGSMGGVFCTNYAGGKVENCANTGAIIAKGDKATGLGGIGGTNQSSVSNVFNSGAVSASTNSNTMGGLLGSDNATSTLTNALNVGAVTAGTSTNVGACVGNPKGSATHVYSDLQIGLYANSFMKGLNTSELITGSWNPFGDGWTATADRYPVPAAVADALPVILASIPVVLPDGMQRNQIDGNGRLIALEGLTWSLSKGDAFTINGTTLTYNAPSAYSPDTITAQYAGYIKQLPIAAIAKLFEGAGTAENPWLIKTGADMQSLCDAVNKSGMSFSGKYLSVTNDIDMNDISNFTPIGDNVKFEGDFNGNGHTIQNLSIDTQTAGAALFCNVGPTGSIHHLTMGSGCRISGKGNVAAFVGTLDGRIYNCINKATLASTAATAAGIVGTASATAVLENLVNEANFDIKQARIAGILGGTSADGAKISNVVNKGNISGAGYCSGIASYCTGITLKNAENFGNVTGTGNYTSGILSYTTGISTLDSCINYGNISGTSYVGGIATYTSKDITLNRVVNAGNITATTAYAAGILANTNSTYQPVVKNAVNLGDVEVTKASLTTTTAGAAGIVCKSDAIITNAVNFGTLKAYDNIGGAIAYYNASYKTPQINNFINAGHIIATNATPAATSPYFGKPYGADKYTLVNVATDITLCPINVSTGAMKASEIVASQFGSDFICDGKGYPVPAAVASMEIVRLGRTAVIPAEGDNHHLMRYTFTVAADPEVVHDKTEIFKFSGNQVKIKWGVTTEAPFTSRLGNLERTIKLSVDTSNVGIESADNDSEIIEIQYFDLQGNKISTPTNGIAIKRIIFANGKTSTTKEIFQ